MENASVEGEQECWFEKEDALNLARWRMEIGKIAARVE